MDIRQELKDQIELLRNYGAITTKTMELLNGLVDKIEKANPVENQVMLTLEEIENKRDYKTVYLIIATLANLCAATEEKIIDLLTGYLWDEEEAGHIKRSA